MPAGVRTAIVQVMTAREIDDAAVRLRELRLLSVENLVLAGAVFALALVASTLWPAVALSLLAGAMAATFLGTRAFVRRWFLLEDLAGEQDAYVLDAVRRFGADAASLERRRVLAGSLRARLAASDLADVREELLELVARLEDERPAPAPQTVVALDHLLHEWPASLPPDEFRARLRSLLETLDP